MLSKSWGCPVPALEPKTVGKMGMKPIPVLLVSHTAPISVYVQSIYIYIYKVCVQEEGSQDKETIFFREKDS